MISLPTSKGFLAVWLLGTAAEKLHELPQSRRPLELVVEAVVKRGMEGSMDSALLAPAVSSMMEGECRDFV